MGHCDPRTCRHDDRRLCWLPHHDTLPVQFPQETPVSRGAWSWCSVSLFISLAAIDLYSLNFSKSFSQLRSIFLQNVSQHVTRSAIFVGVEPEIFRSQAGCLTSTPSRPLKKIQQLISVLLLQSSFFLLISAYFSWIQHFRYVLLILAFFCYFCFLFCLLHFF